MMFRVVVKALIPISHVFVYCILRGEWIITHFFYISFIQAFTITFTVLSIPLTGEFNKVFICFVDPIFFNHFTLLTEIVFPSIFVFSIYSVVCEFWCLSHTGTFSHEDFYEVVHLPTSSSAYSRKIPTINAALHPLFSSASSFKLLQPVVLTYSLTSTPSFLAMRTTYLISVDG